MTKDLTTRIAHTAQIIVASAACVADPTGVSAATVATTGALSLPEVFKRNPEAETALTKPIAKALKKSLNRPTFHMPADGKKLLPQMLDGARLTADDLTGCGLDPDLILGMLLDRHVDPEHRSAEMAEAFCNWLRPPLTELLGNTEFIKTLAPKIWATALSDLRHIRETTDRLEQAVDAFHNALQERTQDKVPLQWAMTQSNLGNALATLGERESGTARLEQAVDAYHNALQEWTQDKVPLNWAATQFNLGCVYLAYFEKTNESAQLDKAEAHVLAALKVFEVASPHYAGMAQARLQQIAELREDKAG